MMTTIRICVFIGLVSTSVIAKVTEVTYKIDKQTIIEGDNVKITCTGTCTNSTVCEDSVSITSIKRTQTSAVCSVRDSGDGDIMNKTIPFVVNYGPDSLSITYKNVSITGKEVNVIEGDPSGNNLIQCTRGDCNDCEMSWTGPAPTSGVTTGATLRMLLSVINYSKKNSGTFTCKVENRVSKTVLEKKFDLIVQYPPTVKSEWNSSRSSLTFKADGVPNKYTFYDVRHTFNGVFIRNLKATNINGNRMEIIFEHATYQDSGKYTCYVNNGIRGNVTESHTITIEDKPVIVDWQKEYNVSKGDPLDIYIYAYTDFVDFVKLYYVQSKPIRHDMNETGVDITIKMYEKLVNVNGKQVIIRIPEVQEDYFFTNIKMSMFDASHNSTSKYLTLFPQGKPDVPGNFTLKEIKHDSAKFSLETGYYNGANQTLVIEYREAGHTSNWIVGPSQEMGERKHNQAEMIIEDLRADTTYEFRAYSSNVYNKSEYTTVIKDSTPLNKLLISVLASGAFVIIIITIIIVVCCVKKRHKEKRMHTKPIPASSNQVLSNIYSGVPVSGFDTNNDTSPSYENTRIVQSTKPKSPTVTVDADRTTVFYENNSIMKSFKSGKHSHRLNVDTGDAMAPYLEFTSPGDMVEEAYVDMGTNVKTGKDISNNKIQDDNLEDYVDMQSSQALVRETHRNNVNQKIQHPGDSGYIDLNTSKSLVEQTRRNQPNNENHYANTCNIQKLSTNQMTRERSNTNDDSCFLDYENAPKKLSSHSFNQPRRSPNVGRESIPGYLAPPPPPPLDDDDDQDYMNIRLKR